MQFQPAPQRPHHTSPLSYDSVINANADGEGHHNTDPFKHKRLCLFLYIRSEEICDDAKGTDGMPHNIKKRSPKG